MAPRILTGVVALVICAWFVLGILQAHDTNRATALLDGHKRLTATQAAKILPLLDGAGRLNPDRTVDLLRAHLSLTRRHFRSAQRRLEALLRSEPDNLQGWLLLAESSNGNLKLLRTALVQLRVLEPRIPGLK